jgi:hypothetical protein
MLHEKYRGADDADAASGSSRDLVTATRQGHWVRQGSLHAAPLRAALVYAAPLHAAQLHAAQLPVHCTLRQNSKIFSKVYRQPPHGVRCSLARSGSRWGGCDQHIRDEESPRNATVQQQRANHISPLKRILSPLSCLFCRCTTLFTTPLCLFKKIVLQVKNVFFIVPPLANSRLLIE